VSQERRLLLASASPRRRELLGTLGVRFTVVVSRFNEDTLSYITDGEEFVRTAATKKAEEVASRREGLILGVDTDVVAPDGSILGKPTDPEDAKRILRFLRGKTHRVYSGVVLLDSDGQGTIARRETRVVRTDVTFADVPDTAIDNYVATGEPLDKAGAYGIQGAAMPFVTRIEGDLSNVIGLPLWTVAEMLTGFGVSLWKLQTGSEPAA
jgi:septum formation protein